MVPAENPPSTLPSAISGQITFAALEENARALKIDVTCSPEDQSTESKEEKKWSWKLA
jgi:protein arginine N-methyltransferase 3